MRFAHARLLSVPMVLLYMKNRLSAIGKALEKQILLNGRQASVT
jgi:hypothetical protein